MHNEISQIHAQNHSKGGEGGRNQEQQIQNQKNPRNMDLNIIDTLLNTIKIILSLNQNQQNVNIVLLTIINTMLNKNIDSNFCRTILIKS